MQTPVPSGVAAQMQLLLAPQLMNFPQLEAAHF